MSPPVSRRALISAVRRAEKNLRWAGSLLVLPGWMRFQFLETANALARLLERLNGNGK